MELVKFQVGATHVVTPPLGTIVFADLVGITSTNEGANLFKNIKPPVFKGEDKERNKDAIITYLQKWSALY